MNKTNFSISLLYLFSFILLFSCNNKVATIQSPASDINTLRQLMTGSFSSAKQASEDSAYYDISLHMQPIWTDRAGTFLYVEQALTARSEKPYRQRVYALSKNDDGVYVSEVYTLNNPDEFIGKWQTPAYFDQYDITILEERVGCAVYLKKLSDTYYSGSTRNRDCESSLQGAAYATSQVDVFADKIVSWDQGFDSEGTQVWGAEKRGYIFDRIR